VDNAIGKINVVENHQNFATPRAIRGANKKKSHERIFKAQRYGKPTALLARVNGIAQELSRSRTMADPAREVA
jgi:hypothetical protein